MSKTNKNNGGPAFPAKELHAAVPAWFTTKYPEATKELEVFLEQKNGMSLRDWFAGMMLSSILNDHEPATWALILKDPDFQKPTMEKVAAFVYAQADAMIAEREKGQK